MQWIVRAFIGLTLFVLTACSKPYYDPHVNNQLLRPSWLSQVKMDPHQWTQHADSWYFTGEPNRAERAVKYASSSDAISIAAIKVTNFTKLRIEGSFQVQILGNQEANTVYLLGPQAETRLIGVSYDHGVLSVVQSPESKQKLTNVIVRIGMNSLTELTYSGCSMITGRDITAYHLAIQSNGSGPILLDGNISVKSINQEGSGTITLLGVNSRHLDLCVKGAGNVNLSGRVGVNKIDHMGDGIVRILGADSNSLDINAGGNGLTAIAGYVNLKNLHAEGNSQVYLYWVDSAYLNITQTDQSRVGLAGKVKQLLVTMDANAHFDGQYLRAKSAYVRTSKWAHANIHAHKDAFVNSSGNSSVYFFGPRNALAAQTRDGASILPMRDDDARPVPLGDYKK